MQTKLKAIDTFYNGYRFRSRLEARWAIFFDEMKIKYEYEKEGYDLDGVWYLPDFWIPSWKAFVEIKGQEPTQREIDKCLKLKDQVGRTKVIMFTGDPYNGNGYFFRGPFNKLNDKPGYERGVFEDSSPVKRLQGIKLNGMCEHCGMIWVDCGGLPMSITDKERCGFDSDGSDCWQRGSGDSPRIARAATIAREARFDGGK